jgi:hypothetical protein
VPFVRTTDAFLDKAYCDAILTPPTGRRRLTQKEVVLRRTRRGQVSTSVPPRPATPGAGTMRPTDATGELSGVVRLGPLRPRTDLVVARLLDDNLIWARPPRPPSAPGGNLKRAWPPTAVGRYVPHSGPASASNAGGAHPSAAGGAHNDQGKSDAPKEG